MQIMPYQRIMIFGRPGSGKSTAAVALSEKFHIPLHHLDRYFFEAGWQERNYQEFLAIQQQLVVQDRWIIDGNAVQSFEMRWACADLVLYFAYPRSICLWRLLKRRWGGKRTIADRAEGCNEIIRWSLITYMWRFEDMVKEPVAELAKKYPTTPLVVIRSDADLQEFYKKYMA